MRLDHEARRLGRKPGSHTQTPHNIMPEVQIYTGKELVHLHRINFAVPLQIRTQPCALRAVSDPRRRFESPSIANPRSVQRAREHRIEVELESTRGAFQDRTNFNVTRIGQELRTHK